MREWLPRAQELQTQGLSYRAIAAEVGSSYTTVRSALNPDAARKYNKTRYKAWVAKCAENPALREKQSTRMKEYHARTRKREVTPMAWHDEAKRLRAEGKSRREIAEAVKKSVRTVEKAFYGMPPVGDTDAKAEGYAKLAHANKARQEALREMREGWPRGQHRLGCDPFRAITDTEIEMVADMAPEAAMYAIAQARGLPL
jgi:transposase